MFAFNQMFLLDDERITTPSTLTSHLIKQLLTWYWLTQYLSTQEVIITSAIGLDHYHFFWVDESLCQPYQKSLIVYYHMFKSKGIIYKSLIIKDWSQFLFVHEEITSIRLHRLHGMYNLIEVISNELNK